MVALKSAHFGPGNADLKLDEIAALDNFARRFCGASESIIELRGYAEGAGSAAQDLALSTERAKAVARFLTDRGVPQERILIIGLGEVDPESHRYNPEHQRVDIRIFEHSSNDSTPHSSNDGTPGDGAATSGSSGEK
jgi:outer membrane protein OmpA-like peptidoglycan-associated protein